MTTTRELANQLQSGKELDEREIFLRLLHHFGEAQTLSRGMAQSRKDMAWLHVAKTLEQLRLHLGILMHNRKQPKYDALVFK